jgi:hypothetical protein
MTSLDISQSLLRIGKGRIRVDSKKNKFKSFPCNNSRKGTQLGQSSRIVHQQNFPSQSGNKPVEKVREREEEPNKGPLQCWECG